MLIGKGARPEKSPSAVMNENQLMQDSAVTNSEQPFVLVMAPQGLVHGAPLGCPSPVCDMVSRMIYGTHSVATRRWN